MNHVIRRLPESGMGEARSSLQKFDSLLLTHWMEARPNPFPRVTVKVGYAPNALHLLFQVRDWYVRAIAAQDQDAVCGDSCVEFFFAPDPETPNAYVNLEINCGGTLLLHTQTGPKTGTRMIPQEACALIQRAASLPRQVNPEQAGPLDWEVTCILPFDLLEQHCRMIRPAPGVIWQGNFYKCADATSHPHWLTWAPISGEKPDFHRPDAFRPLRFD